MTKIYSKLLFILVAALGLKANGQCTGCTTNVTGLDAANHIISSGQTLCVASTGTMTGLITISPGGTLCNQGKIQSTNLWVAGGTLKNYGTIDTYSVLVSSAGTFTNYSTALIDSLMITNSNSTYINNGTQTGTAFTTADYATTLNTGSINVYDMWDTLATFNNTGAINITHNFGNAYTSNFTNNGSITITNDFGNVYTATFTNNGNVTVNNDFANSYSSNFMNSNYMKVTRDFYNSTSANFTTKCMMLVNRDWYNSANVYGPALTSCGGFSITGGSYNSGVLGSASTHIDICDAGQPTLGMDGPGGTIAGTTTYCTCTNNCTMVSVGVHEIAKESELLIENVYPNPASSNLTIRFNNKEGGTISIEIRDMMGKTIMTKTQTTLIGVNESEINISSFAQGTYILSITDSKHQSTKQMFNVTK